MTCYMFVLQKLLGPGCAGNYSEHRNGKPAPKDIGDWINLQASPKVWVCGLALALAEKLASS